ncbi:uncharacterized protein LOC108327209 [Vigna angularis]|uniref:uncharacterized protein LOC108327209 n=1 Tax=Phaseolus angularis TaxID=3914 RepID=UPI0022B5ABD0|nr:uncharacterized protein LOC108327209 [Vigna angularis]
MEDAIVCVFHHGGKFINDSTLKYEGETTTLSFDPDMWSFFVVVSVVKSLRYENFKDLWYCLGGGLVLENRLEQLIDDRGAMHMANLARLNGEVHLYVVHVVSDLEVIHMLEDITNDEGEVEGNGTVQKEGEEDGDSVQVNGEGDGDLQEVNVCEEDGDGVEVIGVVDGDLQEVNVCEEDGDGVEVNGVVDGDLQEVNVCEEDGDGVEVNGVVDGDLQEVNVCQEDGDGVEVNGVVDGDLEDVNEGEEDGGAVEVEVEGHGHVQELHEVKEEQELNVCEGVVEDEVYLCSWSTSTEEGLRYRSKIQSFSGPICAKIQARFTKESQATKNWIPSWSAHKLFEVRHVSQSGEKFVVNIDEFSCSCRRWSITGIPCCHSLAAMKFLNIDGQQFIPACFLKSTYEETYASIVYPINGNNMWDLTPYPDVMPPRKKVMPGRPKRKRRLEQLEIRKDDSRVSKGGLRKRCGLCREVGHNRSRCPKATQEPIMPSSQLSEVCMNDQEAQL